MDRTTFFLKKARSDYASAVLLLDNLDMQNPLDACNVGWCVYQAIEKALLYILYSAGHNVLGNYGIASMIGMIDEHIEHANITKWVRANASKLTEWGERTRYDQDYSITISELVESVTETHKFLLMIDAY